MMHSSRKRETEKNSDLADLNLAGDPRGFGAEVLSSVTSQKSVIKNKNFESLQVFDIKDIQITEKQ